MRSRILCSFPDCGRRVNALGLCETHYQQRRKGLTLQPVGYYKGRRAVPTGDGVACSFPGCINRCAYGGLCNSHRTQQQKGQRLRPVKPHGQPISLIVRSLVERERDDACWTDWPFGIDPNGRPRVWWHGRSVRVAALVVRLEHGVWAVCACHTCDVPACWSPVHLYPGTKVSNAIDVYTRRQRAS